VQKPLAVFIGYDPRQPVGITTLSHSILRHSSVPVAITALKLDQLPLKRRGLTEFTYSRFLVPYLCGYEGQAAFMDADIVVKGDIAEMFKSDGAAVQVMQNQPAFEWASVMLFDNAQCKTLTPEFVEDEKNVLFDLKWAESVGNLPDEWNHCVGYQEPKDAKLYHYTQGLPCWYETQGLVEDKAWLEERDLITRTVPWKALMGNSVHAKPVIKRLMRRLGADPVA
jgi:hypothetical protein